MEIRDALETDLGEILAIYNQVIAESTAVFTEMPATLEDRKAWWQSRVAAGYPVLVAAEGATVRGFATFGDFRSWPGYRFTVEHSVHVADGSRGRGIGRQLVEALFPRAEALRKHIMVAGIDAANTASIRFHERLRFERVGLLREVGYKFGRRLDLALLQRRVLLS